MAGNWRCHGVATLGKRLVTQKIWTHSFLAPSLSAPSLRRSLNTSVYDKNIEEQVCPVVVPDDIISPLSDKYWAPNPRTGVFGPPNNNNNTSGGEGGPLTLNDGVESVLEQQAFFRPLEDLDSPELHP